MRGKASHTASSAALLTAFVPATSLPAGLCVWLAICFAAVVVHCVLSSDTVATLLHPQRRLLFSIAITFIAHIYLAGCYLIPTPGATYY